MPEYKFKNSSWYDFIDDNFAQKVKKNINKLIPLQNDKNNFQEEGFNLLRDLTTLHKEKRVYIKTQHVLNKLITFLKNDNKLPAICFVFSSKCAVIFHISNKFH